jgi:2-dehydro-3-deoxygluconokinase
MPKIITFGEVMARLSPPGKKKLIQTDQLDVIYSGAEANLGVALSQWGMQAAHVTRFPDNPLGHAATASLRKVGVDTSYIQFGEGRLGLYFVEHGAGNRATQITYDRLPSTFQLQTSNCFDWENILEGADWFHWTGITPAISQSAADSLLEALKVAKKKGVKVSGDINYRSGLWQYGKTPGEVLAPLVEYCQVVVAAASDTTSIFNITASEGAAGYKELYQRLKQRFPMLEYLFASQRGSISASHNTISGLMCNGSEVIETRTYDVDHIVDRIGSGDAFAAGFVYASLKGEDDAMKIEMAAAASVLKHTIEGDFIFVTIDELRSLIAGNTGGRVKR